MCYKRQFMKSSESTPMVAKTAWKEANVINGSNSMLFQLHETQSVVYSQFFCPFPIKEHDLLYPASRVSFDLPRKIGKRKETLLTACTILIQFQIQM